MADSKITALTALTTPATEDLLAIVDDPSGTPITKKVTIANLLTLFLSNVVVQVLTSASGTYTPTTGMKKVLLILVGPGGNGAGVTAADDAGGGGAGGATAIALVTASFVGASKPYNVGQSVGNSTRFNTSTVVAGSGGNGNATGNTVVLGAGAAGGAGGLATGVILTSLGKLEDVLLFSVRHTGLVVVAAIPFLVWEEHSLVQKLLEMPEQDMVVAAVEHIPLQT